ncbi:amino acid permease [Clavulina sp. PMI_390]|nr:amino acid permease [Clavulina sp. PMI_390]
MSNEKHGEKAPGHSVVVETAPPTPHLNRMTSIEARDEMMLATLGYRQEFKRDFSLWSSFSVSFAVLGILPSVASTLSYSLGYSGTAGLTWGWIIAFVGIQCVANSMAELSSSMPTSGGLYYCVGVLAPPKWAPFLAYLTGWSNWLGLVSGSPSVNYGNAAMISALATLNNPNYVATNAKTFGITVALTFVCAVFSALPTKWIARVNTAQTYLQIIGLLVVMIGLAAGADGSPKFQSNHAVWGTIDNQTDWPDGIAILMSFLTAIWTMSGYDAPFHLSEECSNAQIATPRAIVLTSFLGGTLGWFLCLVISYVITDVGAVLDSPLGQPFIAVLAQVLPQKTAMAFGAITVICGFFCAQGCAISASRLAFAYARDGLLPASKAIAKVDERTRTPINACIFNFVVQVAMLCLIFAGPLAIAAIFSIGATGAYFAFTMPVAMRCFFAGDRWRPGPWNLGRWSLPTGYAAVAYVGVMIPILCFPSVKGADLDAASMNWTVVVWGGPLFLAAVFFALVARKTYTGPKINIEHLAMPDGKQYTVDELREEKTTDFTNLARAATGEQTA